MDGGGGGAQRKRKRSPTFSCPPCLFPSISQPVRRGWWKDQIQQRSEDFEPGSHAWSVPSLVHGVSGAHKRPQVLRETAVLRQITWQLLALPRGVSLAGVAASMPGPLSARGRRGHCGRSGRGQFRRSRPDARRRRATTTPGAPSVEGRAGAGLLSSEGHALCKAAWRARGKRISAWVAMGQQTGLRRARGNKADAGGTESPAAHESKPRQGHEGSSGPGKCNWISTWFRGLC